MSVTVWLEGCTWPRYGWSRAHLLFTYTTHESLSLCIDNANSCLGLLIMLIFCERLLRKFNEVNRVWTMIFTPLQLHTVLMTPLHHTYIVHQRDDFGVGRVSYYECKVAWAHGKWESSVLLSAHEKITLEWVQPKLQPLDYQQLLDQKKKAFSSFDMMLKIIQHENKVDAKRPTNRNWWTDSGNEQQKNMGSRANKLNLLL